MENKQIIDLDQAKEILFQGLSRLVDFCICHDITCFLAFGTLLGAVRSNDFIPWDDDVDIMMLRKDYDRLLSLTHEIEDNDWHLLSYQKTDGYYLPWMKYCHKHSEVLPSRFSSGFVYGLSVDIFPIDCIDAENQEEALKKAHEFNDSYKVALKEGKVLGTTRTGVLNSMKRVLKRLYFVGYYKVHESIKSRVYMPIEDAGRKIPFVPNHYCSSFFARDIAVFPTNVFLGSPKKIIFHGREFDIPPGYEEFLKIKYGSNYIQPPPKEKQVRGHFYTAYYRC